MKSEAVARDGVTDGDAVWGNAETKEVTDDYDGWRCLEESPWI